MKKLIFIIKQSLLFYASFTCFSVIAQKQDTLAPFRTFLQVSSGYKQGSLYLEVEMKNTTNFITAEQDTLQAVGKFYLSPRSSYILFGEMEQFITDSVALLVISGMQRMIVHTDPELLRDQVEKFSGALLKDSSITALAKLYSGQLVAGNEKSIIVLNSRSLLYSSSFPKETIEMEYNGKTKMPAKVTSLKRTLIALTQDQYQQLRSRPEVEKFLLAIEEKGFFLIKEQITSFTYRTIIQDAKIKPPVSVSDRIMKNSKGEFEPVKAFEDYIISIN